MDPTKKNTGRRFDEEFKREAAALAAQPGRTDAQVAEDLGVSVHSVKRWRQRLGVRKGAPLAGATAPPAGPAASSETERELRALRREVEELRQQRAILKKALAIFSLDPR